MNRAVFLDRDGTIIEDCGYLFAPSGVRLETGVVDGLRAIKSLGYLLIVVSNQSGISRGYFATQDVEAVNRHIERLFFNMGVSISAWYFCPHGPADGCQCRKPAIGMLKAAALEHDIDLTRSFVVGDKPSDLELGTRAGATSILVETGHGTQHAALARANGFLVCPDLLEASNLIRDS